MITYSIEEICEILWRLANGIHPITGEIYESKMLRDLEIVNILRDIIFSLQQTFQSTLQPIRKNKKKKEVGILIYDKKSLENVKIDGVLNITTFAQKIAPSTNYTKRDLMNVIQEYLLFCNYLESKIDSNDNRPKKYATSLGEKIGITNELRHSKDQNDYSVILYDTYAQKYIIENFHLIVEWHNDSLRKTHS